MNPALADDASGAEAGGKPGQRVQVWQDVAASGQAQQASLGFGIQHNYFGEQGLRAEAAVSIVAPVGQRDAALPLRGRDQLLAEIADTGQGAVWVVHGLGGCGKTRLALEAAWQAKQQGIEVWWVSAADESLLIAGMHAVGRRLGVSDDELRHGEAADLIWQRLSGRQQPWLLVIDNADTPEILAGPGVCVGDGTGWLRPVESATGMVLVTSRDGRSASWAPWCHRHSVGMLSIDEAIQVLADYAQHHVGLGDETEAAALARRLGGLPLALKIAGSYLAESTAVPAAFAGQGLIRNYRDYQQAVEEGRFDVGFPAPSGEELTPEQARGLIGRTWDLTLNLLEARQFPEARRILRLLATMAEAPVPHELLLDQGILAETPFFAGMTGPRLWQVLQALKGFGLIDLTSNDSQALAVTRLHPLVRDTSCPRPNDGRDEHDTYLRLAARLLYRATALVNKLGRPDDPVTWPMYQLLGPHAIHVFEALAASVVLPDSAVGQAAYAAGFAAGYQTEQGLYSQAGAVQRAVLAAQQQVLGPDHPDTLVTRYRVAYAVGELGNHAAALAEYREVLAAQQQVLGPDHQHTLVTRQDIAVEMAALGDRVGALAEYREVLAKELQVLGPDHPETLVTRHNIAVEMAALGDRVGALAEYRDVLATRRQVLGPDHPHTLITQHSIAFELGALGDHAAALAEYRHVHATRRQVLSPDHPDTLITRKNIAYQLSKLGDQAAALAEYRAVLAAQQQGPGPDHPDTLITRRNIAYQLSKLGDHAAALAEFRAVLAAQQQVLSPDHPDTLITRQGIAYQLMKLGDRAAALAEYRAVLAKERSAHA